MRYGPGTGGELRTEAVLFDQHLEHLGPEDAGDEVGVQIADGQPPPVPGPYRMGDQGVKMWTPLDLIPGGLHGDHGRAHDVLLREGGLLHLGQGLPGAPTEPAEQLSALAEHRPQHPGDGEDDLTVTDRFEHFRGHPLSEGNHALGSAARTELPGATRVGQVAVLLTLLAAQAGKPEVQQAALQETIYGTGDRGPRPAPDRG